MVYIHVIKTKTTRTLQDRADSHTDTPKRRDNIFTEPVPFACCILVCVFFRLCVCKSSSKCQLGRVKGQPCLCTIILHMQPLRNVICHCRNNLLTRSCHVSDFLTFPINTTLQTTCTHIITIFMLWYILHCYLFISIPSGSDKTT